MTLRFVALLSMTLSVIAQDFHGWINEFHYRNFKKDRDLFIEVTGPEGEEGWNYLLVLYQGRDGFQFHDGISLSGMFFTADNTSDSGIGFLEYEIPRHGDIRNGKKGGDGIGLAIDGQCVQFICYGDKDSEVFTAWSGPCEGKTCQNIGVHESRVNPLGKSLAMHGRGRYMENFTWYDTPVDMTPGAPNPGQTILSPAEYFAETNPQTRP